MYDVGPADAAAALALGPALPAAVLALAAAAAGFGAGRLRLLQGDTAAPAWPPEGADWDDAAAGFRQAGAADAIPAGYSTIAGAQLPARAPADAAAASGVLPPDQARMLRLIPCETPSPCPFARFSQPTLGWPKQWQHRPVSHSGSAGAQLPTSGPAGAAAQPSALSLAQARTLC